MIKFIFFILQCTLIKSLNVKNIAGSLLLSYSLNSPSYTQQPTITISNNNIYFYGPITAESCKELDNALIDLDRNSKIFSDNFKMNPPPINLHIQSEGGSLMNTFYVVDLINSLETPVYTYIDGYVASAGSLISVTGKKRFMTKNSFIMIHQLSSSLGEGKFNDLDDKGCRRYKNSLTLGLQLSH